MLSDLKTAAVTANVYELPFTVLKTETARWKITPGVPQDCGYYLEFPDSNGDHGGCASEWHDPFAPGWYEDWPKFDQQARFDALRQSIITTLQGHFGQDCWLSPTIDERLATFDEAIDTLAQAANLFAFDDPGNAFYYIVRRMAQILNRTDGQVDSSEAGTPMSGPAITR